MTWRNVMLQQLASKLAVHLVYMIAVFFSIGIGVNIPKWLHQAESEAPRFGLFGFSDDVHTANREPIEDIVARVKLRQI